MTRVLIPTRAAIAAALVSAAALAQAKSKDEKLCADLADFRAGVTDLQQMGAQSTVGELRQKESQLYATEKRIAKEAKHDKHAQDLHKAIDELNKTVNRLPADSTVASAQASIDDKVSAVASAAESFSQTYCPSGK
jgi:uncharacterized protein YhaN